MYLILYPDGGVQQADNEPEAVKTAILNGDEHRLFHFPPSGDLVREFFANGTWNVLPRLP